MDPSLRSGFQKKARADAQLKIPVFAALQGPLFHQPIKAHRQKPTFSPKSWPWLLAELIANYSPHGNGTTTFSPFNVYSS
jgi:hypothetical protein